MYSNLSLMSGLSSFGKNVVFASGHGGRYGSFIRWLAMSKGFEFSSNGSWVYGGLNNRNSVVPMGSTCSGRSTLVLCFSHDIQAFSESRKLGIPLWCFSSENPRTAAIRAVLCCKILSRVR